MKRRNKRQGSRFFSILMSVSLIVTNFISPIQVLAEPEPNTVIESGDEGDEEIVGPIEQVLNIGSDVKQEMIDDFTIEEAFESTEDEASTLEETNSDEQVEENTEEKSQDELRQDENIEGGETSVLEEGEMEKKGEESSPRLDEREASPTIRNQVNVTTFVQLQQAISNAGNRPTTIILSNHLMINQTAILTIEANQDITIRTNTPGASGLIRTANIVDMIVVNGRLRLEGIQLNANRAGSSLATGGVTVNATGHFTMEAGTIIQNGRTNGNVAAAGVTVNGGTFIMNGGEIRNGVSSAATVGSGGGGVRLNDNASFTLVAGSIHGNVSNMGGGVNAHSGVFVMKGGEIHNNTVHTTGGGGSGGGVAVNMRNNVNFIMEGGEIHSNTSNGAGGGIGQSNSGGGAANSSLIMRGGEIHNNTASSGGGIHSTSIATTLEGGKIHNNTANGNGGGINTALSSLFVGNNVQFSGNQSGTTFEPPVNVISAFPSIQTTSASIHGHPLNNRDIAFTTGRTLTVESTVGGNAVINIEGGTNLSSGIVASGTSVNMVAEPERGFTFTGWTSSNGGSFANANSASTTFTMPNANTTITAKFEPITHQLTLQATPTSGGSPTAGQTTVPQGGTTQLNANPNSGYRFVRWEVNGAGSSVANANSAQTTFTMGTANATVTAVYERITHNLTLQATPTSGGSPTAGQTTVPQGGTTQLNANPNSGYRFVRWEINGAGSSVANANSAQTTFTMGTANATVTAVYERMTHNLTLQATPTSGGSPTAGQTTVPQGGTTQLNANPNSGYRFVRWEVDGAASRVADETNPTTTFTMGTANATVTAVFEGTLGFEYVPDRLEFEEVPFQAQMTTVGRVDPNWSLAIRDTRGENSTWNLMVSMDSPLMSEEGHVLHEALVFKRDGEIQPLTHEVLPVHRGTGAQVEHHVSWASNEGILVHMLPYLARANANYQATLTWTLQDAP